MNYRGRYTIRAKACSTSERQLLEYALVNEGQLVDPGEKDGRSRIVITHYRTTQGTGTNQDQGSPRLGEDTGYRTVAGLFADPPRWLPKQLEVYRENPRKHIGPLCAAVSAVVLGDGTLGHEVREEVERELAK